MKRRHILSEWLQLKLLLSSQRAVKPLELYASLLISKPDSFKNVLVLVEIMTVLSPCTASCKRSFSAMNRIKTSLKTTMQQGTLQDLITVSSSSEDVISFDPKPAISNWFLGSKRKSTLFWYLAVDIQALQRGEMTVLGEQQKL